MKCKEIINILEETWPLDFALEWDNVGLLVGNQQKEINHIFVALDLNEETLQGAMEVGADMIITHHPLIFSGLKKINTQDLTGNRVYQLIRQDICCFAMHTNYDVVSMGTLNANTIQLQNPQVLSVTKRKEQEVEFGIGCIGTPHKEMELEAYGNFIKQALGLPQIFYYGEKTKRITKVAISGGSGKSVIEDALEKGADLLITGDLDYHAVSDALACGMSIIDGGHYGTEYGFMQDVAKKLEVLLGGITISVAKTHHVGKVL